MTWLKNKQNRSFLFSVYPYLLQLSKVPSSFLAFLLLLSTFFLPVVEGFSLKTKLVTISPSASHPLLLPLFTETDIDGQIQLNEVTSTIQPRSGALSRAS